MKLTARSRTQTDFQPPRRRVRTALALAAALILGGVIFGGPGAQAASALLNVFVTNDTAHPVPTRAVGTTSVTGTVDVGSGSVNVANGTGNPVPVTQAPGEAVVLRDPSSSDHVVPGENALYNFDTSNLSSVRIGFSAFSGSENCRVSVYVAGVVVDEWTLTEGDDRGAVYDTPGTDVTVVVESTNDCYSYLEAYGLPIR